MVAPLKAPVLPEKMAIREVYCPVVDVGDRGAAAEAGTIVKESAVRYVQRGANVSGDGWPENPLLPEKVLLITFRVPPRMLTPPPPGGEDDISMIV